MRVARGLIVPLVLLALPVSALEVEGLYKLFADSDCSSDEARLRIESGVFYGAEGQCRMENPVNVRDMDAQLFDMACSGEGTQWRERAMFMQGAEGGLIMVWNGYAFRYERCPVPGE